MEIIRPERAREDGDLRRRADGHASKPLLRDPNDGEQPPIDVNRLADGRRIAGEALLPKFVADYGNLRYLATLRIARIDQAAKKRLVPRTE